MTTKSKEQVLQDAKLALAKSTEITQNPSESFASSASNMMQFASELPQDPTAYGQAPEEMDFSIKSFKVDDILPSSFVARSQGGSVNSTGKERTSRYVVIQDREVQYATAARFLEKVVRTEAVSNDVEGFISVKRREIETYFQQGNAPDQDLNFGTMENTSFDLIGQIEPDTIRTNVRSLDLLHFKNRRDLLEAQKDNFVMHASNDILRKKYKNILFSQTLQADTRLTINESPTKTMPTKTMYSPLVATSTPTDQNQQKIKYVELPGDDTLFQSPLFGLKDHYNNTDMHGFGVRFNIPLKLSNINTHDRGATPNEMLKLYNIVDYFASDAHKEYGSGGRGTKGLIPNVKPILLPMPKFKQYFKFQTQADDSKMYSDNYEMLKEKCDIMDDNMILSLKPGSALAQNDVLAILIYPKTYHVYQFAQNNELLFQYNKDAFKVSSGGIMEFRGEYVKGSLENKNSHGTLKLVGEMTECGFLSNPFACVVIRNGNIQ